MMQQIKTFRDFLTTDPSKQFAFLPLQLETCMLLKSCEVDSEGITRIILHVFDSQTHYIGTIEQPHYIPSKK